MKKHILFLLGLLPLSLLLAQSSIPLQPLRTQEDARTAELLIERLGKNSYRNTWNVGSAKKLEGKIYLLEIWLCEPSNPWDRETMRNVQAQIDEMCDWLEEQAQSLGKELSFEKGSFHGDDYEGIAMNNLPRSYQDCANAPTPMPKILQHLGYSSAESCLEQLEEYSGTDNVLALLLINHDGHSCANPYTLGHAAYGYEDGYFESIYVFTSTKNYPLSSQIIAHELLHTYGAWDMYGGQASYEAAAWAKTNYPNEIMLDCYKSYDDLMLSPLNAWLMGLSDEFEEWYWYFIRL